MTVLQFLRRKWQQAVDNDWYDDADMYLRRIRIIEHGGKPD
jgi:hypothetical protein